MEYQQQEYPAPAPALNDHDDCLFLDDCNDNNSIDDYFQNTPLSYYPTSSTFLSNVFTYVIGWNTTATERGNEMNDAKNAVDVSKPASFTIDKNNNIDAIVAKKESALLLPSLSFSPPPSPASLTSSTCMDFTDSPSITGSPYCDEKSTRESRKQLLLNATTFTALLDEPFVEIIEESTTSTSSEVVATIEVEKDVVSVSTTTAEDLVSTAAVDFNDQEELVLSEDNTMEMPEDDSVFTTSTTVEAATTHMVDDSVAVVVSGDENEVTVESAAAVVEEYEEDLTPTALPMDITVSANIIDNTVDKIVSTKKPKKNFTSFDDFTKHAILGEGQFGQVWLVSEKEASSQEETESYAVKIHAKHDLLESNEIDNLHNEITILLTICDDHPFIVNCVNVFHDKAYVYMVLEFCQGGELFSLLHSAANCDSDGISNGLPKEYHTKFYSYCIADALHYMRTKHNIAYFDLKTENVTLDRFGYLKLIDFGLAKSIKDDGIDKTSTFAGTPRYLPPETINGSGHNYARDNWSLGVLIYEMLTGENPFYWEGQDEMSLFRCICDDEFPPLRPGKYSSQVIQLVNGLLEKDPMLRYDTVCEHSWFDELDIEAMRKYEVAAPWIPELKSSSTNIDTSCFDDWSDLEDRLSTQYPDLLKSESVLFERFD